MGKKREVIDEAVDAKVKLIDIWKANYDPAAPLVTRQRELLDLQMALADIDKQTEER